MFTGIIRHLGIIDSVEKELGTATLTISTPLSNDLQEGDSVAVNGVCLTVLSHTEDTWQLRLMKETLKKTNLSAISRQDVVNLERPLAIGERLDGHFVQGHVDGVCTIEKITEVNNDRIFTFRPPAELLTYLIPKGSIALDGVSLTIVDVTSDTFTVSIMPYTLEHTTFGKRKAGDTINMEVDMMSKYVKRFTQTK